LPDQDIFYPVTTEEYAHEVNEWNFKQFGCGYVTKFEVKQAFVENYKTHAVGGSTRTEWWIPASDLGLVRPPSRLDMDPMVVVC